MRIKNLVEMIKHNGLLASMAQLEKLYQDAIENEQKLSEFEARCAALAAENAGLKKFCKDAAFDADYESELGIERGGFTDALNAIKTTATDAFLDEVRAQGVEAFASVLEGRGRHHDYVEIAKAYAAQLRKGVQS
ncbi:TPA: hypothetical protein ACOED8_000771 [Enterobacter hormaechei subsp. xiangfangensis]